MNNNETIIISTKQERDNENAIKIIRNIFLNNTVPIEEDDESLSEISQQLKEIQLLGIKTKTDNVEESTVFDIITDINEDNTEGAVFLYPTHHQIEFYQALEQLKYTMDIQVEKYNFDSLYALAKANATNRKPNDPQFAFYIANADETSTGVRISENTIIKSYEDFAYKINFQPASVLLKEKPKDYPELEILRKKLEFLCRKQKQITKIHAFEGWYNHNTSSKQTTLIIETNKKINTQLRNEIVELQKDYIDYLTQNSQQLNQIQTYITPEAANPFLDKYDLTLDTPFIQSHH